MLTYTPMGLREIVSVLIAEESGSSRMGLITMTGRPFIRTTRLPRRLVTIEAVGSAISIVFQRLLARNFG